jgi:hypothetical protein
MAMSSHYRLGEDSIFGNFSRYLSDELHEYIWSFSRRKFNAKKYCQFVMAFPIGNSRLRRWMGRRSTVFPIVLDGSAHVGELPVAGGIQASPESDYGIEDEARLEPRRMGIHFPRRLFPAD